MDYRERGMALVTVLFLLALFTAMALVLSEKVWQSLRTESRATARQQTMWAAGAGIEWGRRQLVRTYRQTDQWRTYLASATGRAYPAGASLTTDVDGMSVELFLRDNADGDDDPQRDRDLKLYLLARARGRDGVESLVECLCGVDASAQASSYRQAGSGLHNTLSEKEEPLPDYVNRPIRTFDATGE